MSPAMEIPSGETKPADKTELPEAQYHKGVKHLYENGISRLPNRYIFPVAERPLGANQDRNLESKVSAEANLDLPVIDFSELLGPNRSRVIKSLATACREHGFFQLVNHGIGSEVISDMIEVSKRFFELPMEERAKYMSADMNAKVRYGTSFNQARDNVFSWRDFLKLMCHPMSDVLPQWPSSPIDFRKLASTYAEETRHLFLMLMEAILESLGLSRHGDHNIGVNDSPKIDEILDEFEDGSQLMVVNCFPPCPEPDLTLGMPPHSDYGFLTLVLQDGVEGLQIHHDKKWVTVEPIANSFVVNVGDHLEIFSNGRYKSVLHRVLVNSVQNRISVASLHSLPFNSPIKPCPILIDETNPKCYQDTDFPTFLKYLTSCEAKEKSFLETIKLT